MAGQPARRWPPRAASHALIDRRWPVRALLRASGSPGFATVEWGVIAVDQALHLSSSGANPEIRPGACGEAFRCQGHSRGDGSWLKGLAAGWSMLGHEE